MFSLRFVILSDIYTVCISTYSYLLLITTEILLSDDISYRFEAFFVCEEVAADKLHHFKVFFAVDIQHRCILHKVNHTGCFPQDACFVFAEEVGVEDVH